jgi:acetylornithine/succinyldiaminopimelate/putrescine aminotransferase
MAESVEVISHWHQSVDGLSISTLEYFSAVEKALREKEVAGLQLERVTANESGILSAKREYLRVRYVTEHSNAATEEHLKSGQAGGVSSVV